MIPDNTTTSTKPFPSFKGLGILCFYNHQENVILQGHCIDKTSHSSPFSLAGKFLSDYIDPHHNECMEPQDFYQLLICSHNDKTETMQLIVQRSKHNDAAGLSTQPENKDFWLTFETHQWYSGNKAQELKEKYFPKTGTFDSQDLTVCMGDIEFYQK